MPNYKYSAIDLKGKKIQGNLETETLKLAKDTLKARGLMLTEIKEIKVNQSTSGLRDGFAVLFAKKITSMELMIFSRQLATLVASGMQLEEALGLIATQSDEKIIKDLALNLRKRISEGKPLSLAMKESSVAFPESFVATITAGEESGHMSAVLERLADEVEYSAKSKQSVSSALIYPAVMIGVSIAVVIAMMVYVVPQVAGVFENMKKELPPMTKVVMAMSSFLINYGQYLGLTIITSVLVFMYRFKTNMEFKYKIHKAMLTMPIIGRLLLYDEISSWARSLGTLLSSGMPTMQALKVAVNATTNLHIKASLEDVNSLVREGYSINHAVRDNKVLPGFIAHMAGSGEFSGNLSGAMLKVASYYEQYTKMTIDSSLKLIEPMLILVMGGVVLVIVMAVLLPVFQLNSMA